MQSSESIATIAGALVKAQKEIGKAGKNAENPHLKSKYANLAEVWETCQEVLPKHGLAVMQLPAPAGDNETLLLETVLLHESGEWISSMISMPLPKRDPQGYGSALTYARRYGLAAAAGVVQDDDDGHAATPQAGENYAEQTESRQSVPAARSNTGAGGAVGIRELFKALDEADLLEPDPTPERPDRRKPAGNFYGICEKAGLPKSWSKYTPDQYVQAIAAVQAHVARHANEQMNLPPDIGDPFADQ